MLNINKKIRGKYLFLKVLLLLPVGLYVIGFFLSGTDTCMNLCKLGECIGLCEFGYELGQLGVSGFLFISPVVALILFYCLREKHRKENTLTKGDTLFYFFICPTMLFVGILVCLKFIFY